MSDTLCPSQTKSCGLMKGTSAQEALDQLRFTVNKTKRESKTKLTANVQKQDPNTHKKLKKDADFKILQPLQHHKLKNRISRRLLFLICCHLPVLWKKWVCPENVHTCFMLRLTVFVVVVAVLPGTELSDALPARGRAVGPP